MCFTYIQLEEALLGGKKDHVVESPHERQTSSLKYPPLNEQLLSSDANLPPTVNNYGIKYHGQPYVTGASSLGPSQQYPQDYQVKETVV